MAEAATRFAQRLDDVTFAPPKAAIVCNSTASAIRNAADLRRCLAAQIASPVLWDACTDTMAERSVRCVLEVGPGTTLSSLWRSRHPHIPARSADDFRSPEAIAAWVHKMLAS